MRRWAPMAITVPFMLVACGVVTGSKGPSSGDVEGVTWVLDQASMRTLSATVPDRARIDIQFDGSRVSGTAACNTYGGSYDANPDDGSMRLSGLFYTQMACEKPLMALEAGYLRALGDVTGYQVTGEQKGLVLTGGTAALSFVAERPTPDLPLEGTDWTLTTIAQPDSQAVSSTVAGTEVTLTLEAGTARGSGGCNAYHTSYTSTEGGNLTFGPVAATKKMCEQATSDQERAYVAALAAVAGWSVAGTQLTLTDANGQMLLAFSGVATP